jgi:uncharacterized protein YjiK
VGHRVRIVLAAAVGLGLGAAPDGQAPPVRTPAATVKAPPPTPALESYALAAPALKLALPPALTEVSGVTALSETELACVQDEDGVVFLYDLRQRRITRRIPFGPPGDYEDVASVGSRLFVLRSDGALFEIRDHTGAPRVTTHTVRLPTADNEGLCLDARNRRLLIAAKSRLGKGKGRKDERAIFAFDPEKAAARPAPVLLFDVAAIHAFAERQRRQVEAPGKPGGKGQSRAALRFMPSAVAVHPHTGEIFVLSAADRALATFDAAGRVTAFAPLDPGMFRQPEGITFQANGDLVITNEGAGRQATLLVFRQKPRL